MNSTGDNTLPVAAAASALATNGWRLLVGDAHCSVAVDSMATAAKLAGVAARVCGPAADRLRLDLQPNHVDLTLRPSAGHGLTRADVDVAARISVAAAEIGLITGSGHLRPVQVLEIAVDALDIPAVVPFWRAVFGYDVASRPFAGGDEFVVVDPAGQGPTVWFQQMDAPRPQRNRVHFDVTVAEGEAEDRIAAVLAAGGHVVDDTSARAFWVVADPEGNEVCICTWEDRD